MSETDDGTSLEAGGRDQPSPDDERVIEAGAAEGEHSGSQTGPPPLLPFLPDTDVREACEDCAREACEVQRADCLEDDLCTAQLRCNGECDDPGCIESCRGAVGQSGISPLFRDLGGCLFGGACGPSCGNTANWGCVDDFRWPTSTEPTLDAYVRFGVGEGATPKLPLAGVNVSVCCSNTTHDPVPLDAANGAHLELPVTAHFLGYFELEADEVRGGMHQRIHPRPMSYGGTANVFLFEQYGLINDLGWLPSVSTAALAVVVADCMGAPATRVSFQILEQPEARVAHLGLVGLDYATTSSVVGLGFFPELSTADGGTVTVQAVLVDNDGAGGRVVAERQIDLRAGWLSQLHLTPRSNLGF